jgi:hypothetical protein
LPDPAGGAWLLPGGLIPGRHGGFFEMTHI